MLEELARALTLGELLDRVRRDHGGYELVSHHTQGEFHHDVVIRLRDGSASPGPYLVIATNCNGGVKEVLALASAPTADALWHWRCPSVAEFAAAPLEIAAVARTVHWFDPCELLADDARSEIRPEHRERQRGGGWQLACKR